MFNRTISRISKVFMRSVGVAPALLVSSSIYDVNNAKAMFPIIITIAQNLNFGSFICTGASGDVTISTAGIRNVSGDVVAIAGAGVEREATFGVIGSTGVPIVVSVTATTLVMTDGNTNTLIVDDFNIVDTDATGEVDTVTLTTTSATFPIGANFNAVCSNPDGIYTGFYTISATYL